MSDNTKGIFDIILLIFSMLSVVALAYIATKWVSARFTPKTTGKAVRIIDRTLISQDKSLLIIKVVDKYMLISVAPQSIQKLCDIKAEDIEGYISSSQSDLPSFSTALQSSLKEAMGRYGINKEQKDDTYGNSDR